MRQQPQRPAEDEAADAQTAGYGGISAAALATGLARSTIRRGLQELQNPGAVRGGGRLALTDTGTTLPENRRRLLEPSTIGDPMRPLLWVSKSRVKLAAAFCAMGQRISASRIPKLLQRLQYRRQVIRTSLENTHNTGRHARFEPINAAVLAMPAAGQPVISVDTRKTETTGPYKSAGSDYRPADGPEQVDVHDFVDKEPGKVVPYGVCDITANPGSVSVGIDNDAAQFAVNSVRRWRDMMGREQHPNHDSLMIAADEGGSNGSRVRLFKVELQKLVDETGLTLQVCHDPPGRSKRHEIAHRMFRHVTQNWRGTPLTGRLTVVELIAATTITTGLKVRCGLDTHACPKGIKVTDAEMAGLDIRRDAFYPEWNHSVSPGVPP